MDKLSKLELARTINIPHTRKVLFDEDRKKIDKACINYPMGSWQIGEIAELSGQLYGLGIDVINILKKKLSPIKSIQVTISMEDEEGENKDEAY